MVATRVRAVFVLLVVASVLAAQVHLAPLRSDAAVQSAPVLLAGDDSPHVGG